MGGIILIYAPHYLPSSKANLIRLKNSSLSCVYTTWKWHHVSILHGNDNKKIIDDQGSNQNNFQNNLTAQPSYSSNNQILDDTASKKLLEEIIETMKASGRLANKDYFTSSNLDLQRAKLMLCELLFVDENAIYIIDFKGIKYFNEYNI